MSVLFWIAFLLISDGAVANKDGRGLKLKSQDAVIQVRVIEVYPFFLFLCMPGLCLCFFISVLPHTGTSSFLCHLAEVLCSSVLEMNVPKFRLVVYVQCSKLYFVS